MFRTDLALEASEKISGDINGINKDVNEENGLNVTTITIKTETAAKKIGKPIGKYITIEIPHFTDNANITESKVSVIAKEVRDILPKDGLVFTVGLGNAAITPDALGPKTVKSILATRHINGEIARSTGLDALRSVAALSPGVLGQTGIEVSEIIYSITKKINPSAIILIDALASAETKRLGSTVQIANTGISPGSGVGNSRPGINKENMGVPVISIGVPTVVDALTLVHNLSEDSAGQRNSYLNEKAAPRGESMMVTPREIDLLIERASGLIGMSINCALHTSFSFDDLFLLTK